MLAVSVITPSRSNRTASYVSRVIAFLLSSCCIALSSITARPPASRGGGERGLAARLHHQYSYDLLVAALAKRGSFFDEPVAEYDAYGSPPAEPSPSTSSH